MQIALVLLDGVVQQLLLRVQPAQLEVVHRKLGAKTEFYICQVRGGGLRVGARLLHGAADVAPQVGLPCRLPGSGQVVVRIAVVGTPTGRFCETRVRE